MDNKKQEYFDLKKKLTKKIQMRLSSCVEDMKKLGKLEIEESKGFISYKNEENYVLSALIIWLLGHVEISEKLDFQIRKFCIQILEKE